MAHTLPLRNSFIWVAGRNGHASAAGGARHPALVACEGPMRTTCRRPPSSPYVFSRGSIPAAGVECRANGARPSTTSTPHTPSIIEGVVGLGSSGIPQLRKPLRASGGVRSCGRRGERGAGQPAGRDQDRSGLGRVDSRPAQSCGAGAGAGGRGPGTGPGPRLGEDRGALGLPPERR